MGPAREGPEGRLEQKTSPEILRCPWEGHCISLPQFPSLPVCHGLGSFCHFSWSCRPTLSPNGRDRRLILRTPRHLGAMMKIGPPATPALPPRMAQPWSGGPHAGDLSNRSSWTPTWLNRNMTPSQRLTVRDIEGHGGFLTFQGTSNSVVMENQSLLYRIQ